MAAFLKSKLLYKFDYFFEPHVGQSWQKQFAEYCNQCLVRIYEDILQETQYLDLDMLENIRWPVVQKLIYNAFTNVPLYKQIYLKNNDISRKISRKEFESLPLLRKADFRQPQNIITSRTISSSRAWRGITSGSTGEPLRHFNDKKFWAIGKANLYRPWRWSGCNPLELMVQCSTPHSTAKFPSTLVVDPHNIQANKLQYIEAIRRSGTQVLRGYPLSSFELARTIWQEGVRDIKFTHVFFVGHALSRGVRDFFQKNFGAEVYNYYGSQETGTIATECEYHDGLHIHEESFIVEIVDDSGAVVPNGTRGHIAVTSLRNEVMPFIRYDIGDVGMIISTGCSCGRTSRRLFIEGRREDLLLRPDGEAIYGGIIRDVLDEYFFAFQRYQIVQTTKDHLLIRIVPTNEFSKSILEEALQRLKKTIDPQSLFSVSADITENIEPLTNGKYQYIISGFWRLKYPDQIFQYDF